MLDSKVSIGYFPSIGEPLQGYSGRMRDITQQLQSMFYAQHLKWYTHYGAGPCYICDMFAMNEYSSDMLAAMPDQDKKGHWYCERTSSSNDPTTFVFKRMSRRT